MFSPGSIVHGTVGEVIEFIFFSGHMEKHGRHEFSIVVGPVLTFFSQSFLSG